LFDLQKYHNPCAEGCKQLKKRATAINQKAMYTGGSVTTCL